MTENEKGKEEIVDKRASSRMSDDDPAEAATEEAAGPPPAGEEGVETLKALLDEEKSKVRAWQCVDWNGPTSAKGRQDTFKGLGTPHQGTSALVESVY